MGFGEPMTAPRGEPGELGGSSVAELLALHAQIIEVLRDRSVLRSANNPVGDYAETLFCQAFGWQMAAASVKGFDALDAHGTRFQIKGRRLHEANGSRQLSALRNLDSRPFDVLAGVLFNADYSVHRAALIPHRLVLSNTRDSPHTNSRLFYLRDAVWDWPEVRDVTAELKAVALG